ncbi:1-aminocyclopropane-1-carboxylate synthase-like protein 1 [Liolophura sinensis]|uniref:1-aminocyclopropane-1-carboxylate synthase-like protein 1 n=1 Tax=Liolophura sinensis TaxID=3198878 RepID=UPI00315896C2
MKSHANDELPTETVVNRAEADREGLSSQRSRRVTDNPSFLFKWLNHAARNPYDKDVNPQGVVNLGTAENKLCEDLLVEKLSRPEINQTEGFMNYYFTHYGDISFRAALKTFIEEKFHPSKPIHAENIITACGCGGILDMLGFALGDRDDYFLSPVPYYPRISNNLGERGGVQIYKVPLTSQLQPGDTAPFHLTAGKLKAAYDRATKEGKRVRGIVLINPNNPLGDVYTEQQLRDILDFAARYELHVLCDEIYALSTTSESPAFRSILSLKDTPDPDRVYFIWGFSKDFGLAGYRCGLVYTSNQEVLEYCKVVAYYQSVPMCVQVKLRGLITDKDWRENVYFPTNRRRMKAHLDLCKARLTTMGVPIHPFKGGMFIWVDMQKYLGKNATFKEESELFEELIQNGVYCVPGRSMSCVEPGWFRLVFTVTTDELTTGLTRIKEILMKRSSVGKSHKSEYTSNTKHSKNTKHVGCYRVQNGITHSERHIADETSEVKTRTPDQKATNPATNDVKVRNGYKPEWQTGRRRKSDAHTQGENDFAQLPKVEKKRFFKRLGEIIWGKASSGKTKQFNRREGSDLYWKRRTKSEADLMIISYKSIAP